MNFNTMQMNSNTMQANPNSKRSQKKLAKDQKKVEKDIKKTWIEMMRPVFNQISAPLKALKELEDQIAYEKKRAILDQFIDLYESKGFADEWENEFLEEISSFGSFDTFWDYIDNIKMAPVHLPRVLMQFLNDQLDKTQYNMLEMRLKELGLFYQFEYADRMPSMNTIQEIQYHVYQCITTLYSKLSYSKFSVNYLQSKLVTLSGNGSDYGMTQLEKLVLFNSDSEYYDAYSAYIQHYFEVTTKEIPYYEQCIVVLETLQKEMRNFN